MRFRECLFVHSLVGFLRPSGKADKADITPTPVLQVRSCRRKSVPLIPEEGMRWGGRVQRLVSFAYGVLVFYKGDVLKYYYLHNSGYYRRKCRLWRQTLSG